MTKVKFDGTTFSLVDTKDVLSNITGKLINLRSAKYGEDILITYIHNNKDYGTDYPSYNQNLQEKMYYVICDINGNVITGPLEASSQHQALNEDIRPLKDGSLRWGYIDNSNVLRIVRVKLPGGTSVFAVILIILLIITIIVIGVFVFFKGKNKNSGINLKIPFLSR